MNLAVVGTGYVGLVTGTCFAESGHQVVCAERDAEKLELLQRGEMPIYEPGLEELLRRNLREGRIRFTQSAAEAASSAAVVFIAVGTPPGESGEVDLTHVTAAAEEVGRAIRGYVVIANKSTVPVGGTARVAEAVARVTRATFDVVSNPEFLKEGTAVDDFMRPDRVVIGTDSQRARELMAELYAPFVRVEQPVLFMDPASAELAKYASNAMLATRISFMNDIAALCDRLGADVDAVRRGMGSDRRIGYPFLFPGVGWGGSCFPKDVQALRTMARHAGLDFDILRGVERVNERQKRLLFDMAERRMGPLAGKRAAVWGLAFKPRTDDMREAPSRTLIQLLAGAGAEVRAHDPVAGRNAARLLGPHVKIAGTPYEAAEGADALFLVTEWNEFRNPDFERLRGLMRGNWLFDGRNVWSAARARAAGFEYVGVGRPARPAAGGAPIGD